MPSVVVVLFFCFPGIVHFKHPEKQGYKEFVV